MLKAEIIDGVVARVIVVDPENIPDDFADWPEAGAEVGPGWTWDGEVFAPPAVEPAAVKAEAARRILSIAPEWRQRNATARGVELVNIRIQREWTAEEQAEADALNGMWAAIKAIRTASDAIEAMDPIPADFADDEYWLEV